MNIMANTIPEPKRPAEPQRQPPPRWPERHAPDPDEGGEQPARHPRHQHDDAPAPRRNPR